MSLSFFFLVPDVVKSLMKKANCSSFVSQKFSEWHAFGLKFLGFFVRSSTTAFIEHRINKQLTMSLTEDRVTYWVKNLEEALLDQTKKEMDWNDYEKALAETRKAMIEDVGMPPEIVDLVLDTMQEPIANKQLLYTLLDAVIEEIGTDFRKSV